MVQTTVACYHCGSENLNNGKALNGKQHYHCKAWNRASLENPDYGYSEARKDEIIRIRNAQVGGDWQNLWHIPHYFK
jgi:transposase-like protein